MTENELANKLDFTILRSKKILLADDLPLNQFIAKHILETWGCKVSVANNGKEVLDLLQQQFFDCVLMDVQMPELDGLAATRQIRALSDPIKSNVPIIALTSNVLRGDREKYLSTGMNDCIGKPFEESMLFSIIYKHISGNDPMLGSHDTDQAQKGVGIESGEKLYDLKMVVSVSGGDEGFIKKMILLFMETVPQNVVELRKHMEIEHWAEVAKVAHKLKSTIDSMGIKSLHEDIRTVEQNAKQNTGLKEMPFLLQKIEMVIADCMKQLQVEVQ